MDSNDSNPYRSPRSPHEPSDPRWVSEKIVVLATFGSSAEAHLFRSALANEGVIARVANENTTSFLGGAINGTISAFEVEVLILESDAIKGLEVKKRFLAATKDEEQEIEEWGCECGETVDGGFKVCWNCGSEWNDTGAKR